ncbi:MAG: hypothetical protein KatS3mg044_0823 [Rhodothermaceae bacterium]|nr:MAG: hypothetical protein KatS3mg044_0823 [Rhodothermaceae bacterium]
MRDRCPCLRHGGWPLAFCMLALASCCQMSMAQASGDRSRFVRWMYQDAGALVGSINADTPLYVGTAMALLWPVSFIDTSINPYVQRHDRGSFGTFLEATNRLGGPDMKLPVAGVFAATLLTRNERLQDAAFTSLQAMLYAGAITYSLKYVFGRERPFENEGPHDFDPFSGNTSFPSGHTTAAFAILTPWVLYYPHPLTYGLFALATGTAMARLAYDKHWATDVLAGGTIGFLTARYLTRRHQGETHLVRITPVLSASAVSVSLRLVF